MDEREILQTLARIEECEALRGKARQYPDDVQCRCVERWAEETIERLRHRLRDTVSRGAPSREHSAPR